MAEHLVSGAGDPGSGLEATTIPSQAVARRAIPSSGGVGLGRLLLVRIPVGGMALLAGLVDGTADVRELVVILRRRRPGAPPGRPRMQRQGLGGELRAIAVDQRLDLVGLQDALDLRILQHLALVDDFAAGDHEEVGRFGEGHGGRADLRPFLVGARHALFHALLAADDGHRLPQDVSRCGPPRSASGPGCWRRAGREFEAAAAAAAGGAIL